MEKVEHLIGEANDQGHAKNAQLTIDALNKEKDGLAKELAEMRERIKK